MLRMNNPLITDMYEKYITQENHIINQYIMRKNGSIVL